MALTAPKAAVHYIRFVLHVRGFGVAKRAWVGLAILSAAAVVLMSRMATLTMWYSELFSLFHTAGTLDQIFQDPDLAWPPGYYVALWSWQQIVGRHDVLVGMFAVLAGLLTVALIVQVGRQMHSWGAGWLAAFAFATSSYATYFMLENRANGLHMTCIALAVLLHLRWLRRPTWGRAWVYALSLTLMTFVHYFGFFVMALLGLHMLLAERRLWWRWGVTAGVGTLLLLPLIPPVGDVLNLFLGRSTLPFEGYFVVSLAHFYRALSAHADVLFGAIVLLAVGGAVWLARGRMSARAAVVWLMAWGVGVPLAAYITREKLGLFVTGYLSFTLVGIYLLLGLGLAALPRRWLVGVGGVLLAGLALVPWHPYDHRPRVDDVRSVVKYMGEYLAPGDVLLVDAQAEYERSLGQWYYESIFAPSGRFPRMAPDDLSARRIWYLENAHKSDAALREALERGRIRTVQVGEPALRVSVYESAPGPSIQVGDSLTFHGFDISPSTYYYRVPQEMAVTLWWSPDAPLERDYSVSVYLVDLVTGAPLVQTDGPPAGPFSGGQTSAWVPGQLYRDDRVLHVPVEAKGSYQVQIAVYWWAESDNRLPFFLKDGELDSMALKRIYVLSYRTG